MTDVPVERRRTGWDVVLGVLVVVAGLVILAHVVIATAVSVLFLGCLALAAGVFGLVGALFRIGKGGFWATALSGGLPAVPRLRVVRYSRAGAAAPTPVAGG